MGCIICFPTSAPSAVHPTMQPSVFLFLCPSLSLIAHLSSYQFIFSLEFAWTPSESSYFYFSVFLSLAEKIGCDYQVIGHKQMCHSSIRRPFFFRNDLRCIICINHPFYHDRGTKKLSRTFCWYVPGRVVRMSSTNLGQMEDILLINRCVIATLDILNTS